MASLSDSEIRKILRSYGRDCGPIIPQTRNVYLNQIKKLQGNEVANEKIPVQHPGRFEPTISDLKNKNLTYRYNNKTNILKDHFYGPTVAPILDLTPSYTSQKFPNKRPEKPRIVDVSYRDNVGYNWSLSKFSNYFGAKDKDLLDISDADMSDSENNTISRFRKNHNDSKSISRVYKEINPLAPTSDVHAFSFLSGNIPNILLFVFIVITICVFGAYLMFQTRYSQLELDVAMEKLICHEFQESVCFNENELTRLRPSLQQLYSVLCEHAGRRLYDGLSDTRMTFQEAKHYLNYALKQAQRDLIPDDDWNRLMTLVISLPAKYLHITAYDNSNEILSEARFPEDVTYLKCMKPKCSLLCRLKLAWITLYNWVWYVIYTVIIIGTMFLFGYGSYLYRRRKRLVFEKRNQELKNILSDMCEILEEQLQQSQSRANENSFVSLSKIRLMLQRNYPRLQENDLWDKVKDYAFKNEPRIEMRETIANGICLQWRGKSGWTGSTVPVNQEPLFERAPTECLKIRNIVVDTLNYDWEYELRSELRDLLRDVGVRDIGFVHNNGKVVAYVMCSDRDVAGKAFVTITSQQFRGNLLKVKFIRLEKYEARFPGTTTK